MAALALSKAAITALEAFELLEKQKHLTGWLILPGARFSKCPEMIWKSGRLSDDRHRA